MTDLMKILCALGLGIYTAIGIHYYSIAVSRTRNDLLRILLFLMCILLFIAGGFIGCAAVMGALHPSENTPVPKGDHMRFFIFLAWIGVVWLYLIFNWRQFMQRLKAK